MHLDQFKKLAKSHLSDRHIKAINWDGVHFTSVDCFREIGQIHYLHDIDVPFEFTTPTKSHMVIEIRQNFVHIRVDDDWDLNQLAIIKDLRDMGLLMESV